MQVTTVFRILAGVGFGLLLVGCSTTNAGRAALPSGSSSSHSVSAAFKPSSTIASRSTELTTITEPSALSPVSAAGGNAAPSNYTPLPQNQASIDGWIAIYSNGAAFLGWTITGETVAGTYSETLLAAAATTVTTDTASFSGTISGSSVTLTFSHGFGSTVSGELVGNTLTLSIPQTDGSIQVQTYHPGTTADYNAEVQVVQSSAAQRQAAAASISASASVSSQLAQTQLNIDQAAQHVQAVMSQLTASTSALDGSLNPLAGHLATQAADLKTVQTDAAKVSSEAKAAGKGAPTVCGDGATAQGEADTVQGDADTITADIDGYGGQKGAVQSDLDQLNRATADLANAQSALPNYTTSAPSDSSVSAVLNAAKAAEAKGDKETAAAQATADAVTKEAMTTAANALTNAGC